MLLAWVFFFLNFWYLSNVLNNFDLGWEKVEIDVVYGQHKTILNPIKSNTWFSCLRDLYVLI